MGSQVVYPSNSVRPHAQWLCVLISNKPQCQLEPIESISITPRGPITPINFLLASQSAQSTQSPVHNYVNTLFFFQWKLLLERSTHHAYGRCILSFFLSFFSFWFKCCGVYMSENPLSRTMTLPPVM